MALKRARLNRISQAKRDQTQAWKEGVALERDGGTSISILICRSAAARWRLARSFRTQGNKISTAPSPQYRSAISRYYYSMYHAMRACVYLSNEGDDFEAHSTLPTKIPATFDPGTDWADKLKNARLLRNRADYDTYPASNNAWAAEAQGIKKEAGLLLKVSKGFLVANGCVL